MPVSSGLNQPRIVWDGKVLDFADAVNTFDPNRLPMGTQKSAISGASESITWSKLDHVRIRLRLHNSAEFHRDLDAFWSWASEGRAFSLSFDRYDRLSTTLTAVESATTEKVLVPLFDAWASDTDCNSWAETVPASGSINRVEDLRNIHAGVLGLSITSGGSSNGFLDQTVTLATSTKYRLQVRVRATAAHKMFFRIQNDSSGNYLQDDLTWSASAGIDNEPTITTDAGSHFLTYTWDFTTESSGTAHSARVYIGGSGQGWALGDILYVGEFSIRLRPTLTLASTDGVIAGREYRLRQDPEVGLSHEKIVIDTVDSATVVTLQEPLRFSGYASGDQLRSVRHYPSMRMEKVRKQPHRPRPIFLYDFDLRAVEYLV